MGMPRVVVDTSVIVAGLRSQLGASNRIALVPTGRRNPEFTRFRCFEASHEM